MCRFSHTSVIMLPDVAGRFMTEVDFFAQGKTGTNISGAPVPEPSTLVLGSAALAGLRPVSPRTKFRSAYYLSPVRSVGLAGLFLSAARRLAVSQSHLPSVFSDSEK